MIQGEKFFVVYNNEIISYVICSECKKCYQVDMIHCLCNYCNVDYYTSLLNQNESPDLLLATLSNSHCKKIKQDKLKCPRCKNEQLYIDFNNKILRCLKKKCD